VQAHALGEVGTLGTVLLRVYSGILLPIFIEIGSYLTDKEQKISWHSFFETRCSLQLQCEEKLPRSVWQMSWAVHRYNFSGRRAVTDSEALQM